ncbi:unnamed protein product, partial [Adineta steineri]
RFWLYLIFLIPSVLCALFCLYHFLIDRVLRKALNNHVVMLILFLGVFLNLTDIVWYIDFYRTGHPLSLTEAFCMTWTYIDYAVFVSITLLIAWGSIERHILIFHQNLVSTQIKRFLVHYLPLFTLTMYPFIYYIIIYFVLPCDPWIDFTTSGCGISACAYNTAFLGMWDSIAHNIVPIFTIVIFSLALFGRIWYIHLAVKSEHVDKVKAKLIEASRVYAKDKGTIDWFVSQDAVDPTKFAIVERYEQQSDVQTHISNPYYKEFGAYVKPLLTKPIELHSLAELDTSKDVEVPPQTWSGNENRIPQGWAVCDGKNGSPDLRDRFVIGAEPSYFVSTTRFLHVRRSEWESCTTCQHKHSIKSSGENQPHSHFATSSEINLTPPFYVLVYIMKL